jgi:ABC-type multidrug transport system fused ATPase/permease subunit
MNNNHLSSLGKERLEFYFLKKYIVITIISLLISLATPFIFKNYVEHKPEQIEQSFRFGGPVPFAEQQKLLPASTNAYPLDISFESPFQTKTIFHPVSFIFSFLVFFLLVLSIFTILKSYFGKIPTKRRQ